MAYIKIDKEALYHNLQKSALKAGSIDKIAAVLKDNAYGHSIGIVAPLLKEFGISKAVVRDVKEAEKIRSLFDYILVLNGSHPDFICAVNSLQELEKTAAKRVEIKVDTGMHRNGIDADEVGKAFDMAAKRGLEVVGLFTHYRSADVLSSELFWQKKAFERVKKIACEIAPGYGFSPHFHSQNSAALFREGLEDDFARVGIALYGALEMDEVFGDSGLKPVLSLWAEKIATRGLKKGQRVGYGGEYEAKEDMVISTYDAGYADGVFRSLKRAETEDIIGRISMDNLCLKGDKRNVCIFKDARDVAKQCHTIAYEVLVKLPSHLKRVII